MVCFLEFIWRFARWPFLLILAIWFYVVLAIAVWCMKTFSSDFLKLRFISFTLLGIKGSFVIRNNGVVPTNLVFFIGNDTQVANLAWRKSHWTSRMIKGHFFDLINYWEGASIYLIVLKTNRQSANLALPNRYNGWFGFLWSAYWGSKLIEGFLLTDYWTDTFIFFVWLQSHSTCHLRPLAVSLLSP